MGNNTITILSKSYIKTTDIEILTKEFVDENSLKISYERDDKIVVWSNSKDNSTIWIHVGTTEDDFDNAKGTYKDLTDYSNNFLISYFSDDFLIIPFLKKIVKIYPNILVYNDEALPVHTHKHYTIHNKQDIETTENDNYWSLLGMQ